MNTSGPNELVDDVDKPLLFSNRTLAQLEGVKTDFYTINFARLACSNIHIAPQGQRLYNNCFSNLPVYRSADNRLQFGWADTQLLRNAGVQLYEYEHLLLASALGEFFSEDYAAAVFSALADYFEDDDKPKPHISSFRGFVHAANGIFSTSEFPVVVDDRIRMNPYRDHDNGVPHASQTTELIPITKLAEALHMLAQLRNGKAGELTLVGGDVLGWFSAFTEMCLGVDVTLLDKDGKELHRANPGQTVRLKLIFLPWETSPADHDPSSIWLREALNPSVHSSFIPPILTGRVTGNSIFTKVFGNAFHKLDQIEAKSFGNALGGLARAWEFFAQDEEISAGVMSAENKSDPGSHGMGLIQAWTNWFPELRHLQGRMERALRQDHEGAGRLCDDSIAHLEHLCGCYVCSPTKGSEDNPTNLPAEGFCIPALMETVIMLGLSLSSVTLAPSLYLSRAGILTMYKSQVRKRLDIKKTHAAGLDRHKILFGDDWNATYPKRLASVIAMFSGSLPREDMPENLMGLSHEGICAYSLKLQRGDFVAPNLDDHVIRVVSGSIQWKQKALTRLCLGPVQPPVGIEGGWESVKCDHLKDRVFFK